jgi:hypothetical protein
MGNCIQRINLDGEVREFHSDEELHSFLRENKKSLVTSLLTGKIVFSTDKTKQDIASDLLTSRSDKMAFDKVFHRLTIDGTEYEPVTKFIVSHHLVKGFDISSWEVNKRQQLLKELNVDGTQKYTPEQANDIVKGLRNGFETQSLVGTSWHDIAEKFFNGTIKTGLDILDLFPQLKGRDYLLKKYISTLTDLKAELIKRHGDDAIFHPEVKLWDDKAGVAGIADLVVIDREGKHHVYDYKTSGRDEGEWTRVKLDTIEYQLGTYKQLMRRNGMDVESISYIPIKLKDIDYTDKVVNDFDITTPKGVYLPDNEKVMRSIDRLMPYDVSVKLGDVTSNKAVYQFMKEAFNYERPIDKVVTPASIDEEYVKLKTKLSNDGRSYVVFNPVNLTENDYIPINLGEAAIKKKLAESLKRLSEYQRMLPTRFYDFVQYAKNQMERNQPIDWESRWAKDDGTVNKMISLLTKYIMDPAWKPLQSDALYDMNTVAFENRETDQIDLITLSSDNLDKTPQLLGDKGKATSLLGNFMSDSKALFNKIPAKVTNGDVELLKLMAFIKNNQELFGDRQIGNLYALNILEKNIVPSVYTQTVSALESQWAHLMKHVPSTLDIRAKDWTIKGIDFVDAFVQDITNMFDRTGFNPSNSRMIKHALDNLENATTKEEKIANLDKIANKLLDGIGYNPGTGVFRKPDASRLIYLAAQAVMQLEELPTIREHDMKNYANLLKENINTSNPTSMQNQAMQNVVALTRKGLANTTHAFNIYKEKARAITSDLYKAHGTLMGVKVIGYNLDVFKNMLEKDSTGKLTMRLKDPNAKDISPAESKYIKEYMKLLGEVRKAKLGLTGDADTLTPEHARNIPLMRASELTAFVGQNYKEWFKNYFRDIVNPNNIYENDKKSWELLKSQSRMFNFFDNFDINLQKRAERLEHSESTEFETDLEAVMDMYFMIHAKEQEMNKIMPAINAQKMLTMFSEHYMFVDNAITAKAINDYVATVIFDKNLIAEESKGLAIGAQVVKNFVAGMTMGVNVASGITHMALGIMNNVTRLSANKFDKASFQEDDLIKASKLIYGDLNTNKMSFEHVGFCDNINEMYRISDMNLKELVHRVQTTSSGVTKFGSHWAFWLQSLPIYTNRMSMFMGQMIHEGIVKVDTLGGISKDSALQLIKGKLVYNDKLDDRYKEYLAKPDLADHLQKASWKEARASYLKAQEVMALEPGGIKENGSLARPYDNKTRDSLKTIADDVHGNYDKDTRTRLEQLAFGKMFLQFKTYLTSKKNRWYMETHPDDQRGQWVTEYSDTGEPIKMWQGRVTEGIYQTLCALTTEVKNSGSIIKSWDSLHVAQKQNVALMMGDILQFGLYSMLLGLIGYAAIKKTDPVQAEMLRGLSNANSDLWIGTSISALAGEKNPIAVLSWGNGVLTNSWGVLTGQPNATRDLLNHAAAFRVITAATK